MSISLIQTVSLDLSETPASKTVTFSTAPTPGNIIVVAHSNPTGNNLNVNAAWTQIVQINNNNTAEAHLLYLVVPAGTATSFVYGTEGGASHCTAWEISGASSTVAFSNAVSQPNAGASISSSAGFTPSVAGAMGFVCADTSYAYVPATTNNPPTATSGTLSAGWVLDSGTQDIYSATTLPMGVHVKGHMSNLTQDVSNTVTANWSPTPNYYSGLVVAYFVPLIATTTDLSPAHQALALGLIH